MERKVTPMMSEHTVEVDAPVLRRVPVETIVTNWRVGHLMAKCVTPPDRG